MHNIHEIRRDEILNRNVIVATTRRQRPSDFKNHLKRKKKNECEFCPGNENKTPPEIERVEKKGQWIIRVFDNKFAPLSPNYKKAYGISEIIVETPKHNQKFSKLSSEHIVKVIETYISRIVKLSKKKKIKYVLVFKNSGREAGASLAHEHAQVVAFPYIPPRVKEESQKAKKYQSKNKSCFICDIIEKEEKNAKKIFVDENIISFAPYTSLYHYEAWITTRRHLTDFTKLNTEEKKSLANILKKIIRKLDKDKIAYNILIYNYPPKEKTHFHIEVVARENVWAGVELGSGMIVNSIPPEEAAEFYKE